MCLKISSISQVIMQKYNAVVGIAIAIGIAADSDTGSDPA